MDQKQIMDQERVGFRVTRLEASAEGVPIEWQGRLVWSGPLNFTLDDARVSTGLLDYAERQAEAEFRVKMEFPVFTGVLQSLGVGREWVEPIHATLRSRGEILNDHGFALSGRCEFAPHELTNEGAVACVLPGQ